MTKNILRQCISSAILHRGMGRRYPRQKSFHVAYMVQGNTLLSWAYNSSEPPNEWQRKMYPDYAKEHAEIAAYRRGMKRLNSNRDYEMISLRVSADGSLGEARPCKCCDKILRILGCRRVYYSCKDGRISNERL